MSKDFAQIANDVITGVGLLQRGTPDAMKAFWGSFDGSDGIQSNRYENEGADGARDRHRGPLRRLRRLSHENGASTRGNTRGNSRNYRTGCVHGRRTSRCLWC